MVSKIPYSLHHALTYNMADELKQGIDNALNKIVNTTDQSGNMRKDLKKMIYETVTLFYKLKETLDDQTKNNNHLEDGATKKNIELDPYHRSYTGCNRRNVPYFRRVFLMLNYNEKTQNTYNQI
jgi:hypothetical protein